LLNQLCKSKPAHRFTLQLSYQDVFKSIQDYNKQKLTNLAILFSNILVERRVNAFLNN